MGRSTCNKTNMEQAILITSISGLNTPGLEWDKYSRVYFGSEFCIERLPSIADLHALISFCGNNGKEFTLLTPYLPEEGIAKVEKLLDSLHKRGIHPEILISDWGMLHFIPEKFGDKFPLVLGRIAAKQKTGPRVELIKDIRPAAYESSKKSHIDIPPFIHFLKQKGVNRIDLDMPLQGIDITLPENSKISLSINYPYSYISTTRRCPIRESGACDCSENFLRLSSAQMPVPLYNRGNTVFFRHEEPLKIPSLPQLNRIIFEPEVP